VSEPRFNLVDEPWIPVVGAGRVSLGEVFRNPDLAGLGGNPLQKIALTKLLLAVVQAAWTPADEDEWKAAGRDGMATRTQEYLKAYRDDFWLYGPKPFLQIPAVAAGKLTPYGAVDPRVATGNTTVHTQGQTERSLDDADRAVLVVQLMGLGLGGKKTDNSVVLTPGYQGKTPTGKTGASLGFMGFLHTFPLGPTLQDSLYAQVVTRETLAGRADLPQGLGPVPWETPPSGEDCSVARALKESLMGSLVPFSRFVLLEDDGLRYTEGLAYKGYKEGRIEPSMSVDRLGKEPKVIWVDAEKRPWRQLTALLSFLGDNSKARFECAGLKMAIKRLGDLHWTNMSVWSGGLSVSSNSGEQFVSGADDFVDSEVQIESSSMRGDWYARLSVEMAALEELADHVKKCTWQVHKAMKAEPDKVAAQASNLFWHLAEGQFPALLVACKSQEAARNQRKDYVRLAHQAYNAFCPHDTARQIEAWAAHRPNYAKYLG